MENDILVEILIPASGRTYDTWLPRDRPLGELLPLVRQVFGELAEGLFTPTEDTALYDLDSGRIFETDLNEKILGGTEALRQVLPNQIRTLLISRQ